MPSSDSSEKLTVALVEDDDDIRDSLALLIDGSEGFSCVIASPDCESAIPRIVDRKPDVVLMDIQLPGMNGIQGVRRIKEESPDSNVIMLTIHKDNELVFRSLCAGASGYLVKNAPTENILEAIREVAGGGAPMTPGIARMIVDSFHRGATPPLTARESEVLTHLCKGHSYKVIADGLFISEQTVHFHIKNIYTKLQVHSKAEAVAKAMRERLV